MMPRVMKTTAVISTLSTLVLAFLYCRYELSVLLTLAITLGTVAYHLIMRLAVGALVNATLKNKVNYNRWWFRQRGFERKLYRLLRVRSWKGKMPTYDPSLFSREKHSWDEIAQAMCQAEIVHEIIMLFSLLPILASIKFGSVAVFVITSVLSAGFDSMFVIMQRYNRPRVIRVAQKENKRERVENEKGKD